MKTFKEFGIKPAIHSLTGDKIKVHRILNCKIEVLDYRIEESKYTGKCLYLQIRFNDNVHLVFTGSKVLIDTIQQVPKTEFPFSTTIIKENERLEFS